MASRLIVSHNCPYCHSGVDHIPDHKLKKNPGKNNVEFVVTKTGRKQYFHTSCFADYVRWTKEQYA